MLCAYLRSVTATRPVPQSLRQLNGSNWLVDFSMGNAELGSLLVPGDTPHENAQFLVFCAAVIRAVHKFAGLLRVSVASATNDHRLGANEAPPRDHLDLPRRAARRRIRADRQEGAATSSKGTVVNTTSTRCPRCRPTPAIATGPARSAFTDGAARFRAPGLR